ncbi:suppressor of fused domain protein [Rhizohabitans arisaemae]|uniref:suppressor of fused domain protein n=1 Tax=Rhizohabitans arisaemae TaxID=2720610 RepID=UPI0024B0895B|nr:suppressor of fused domain protein [Rhizohabitans arisaemae]
MAVFRKSGSTPDGTNVILTDTNPYGSRRLVVESDHISSVAYLCDPQGVVKGAVWLANHQAAPPAIDLGRLNDGLSPVMPRSCTSHPLGSPPIDPDTLDVVWFEEGDGVVLYEQGTILAVIPGWADMTRGIPGFSLHTIGETPFAWSLRDALGGLDRRISGAKAYWEWRRGSGAWETFQQFIMGHLSSRLGPGGRYWDASDDRVPTIGITERPPRQDRDYTLLSTVGMSCQRMPSIEQYVERSGEFARVELAMATRGDGRQAARLFPWLAQYPWHSVTWLGHGHIARWYHDPATFPLGPPWSAVLLLSDDGTLPGGKAPDLSGFTFGGDVVRWLWLLPISEAERRLAAERGYPALVKHLTAQGRGWLIG